MGGKWKLSGKKMTGFTEFHANIADRTRSICVFKRQNDGIIAPFFHDLVSFQSGRISIKAVRSPLKVVPFFNGFGVV